MVPQYGPLTGVPLTYPLYTQYTFRAHTSERCQGGYGSHMKGPCDYPYLTGIFPTEPELIELPGHAPNKLKTGSNLSNSKPEALAGLESRVWPVFGFRLGATSCCTCRRLVNLDLSSTL